MKIIALFLFLIITSLYSKAQETQSEYLSLNLKPVDKEHASYKLESLTRDSILTRHYYRLQYSSEAVEYYKNNIPVGKWKEFSYGNLQRTRNFDDIVYMTESELKKKLGIPDVDSINDTIIDPGWIAPTYKGGEKGRLKFLRKHLKYPLIAHVQEQIGTTYLDFIVNMKGEVENIVVTGSSNPYLDYEAVRVARRMYGWKPGTYNGKPVSVLVRCPIEFKSSKLRDRCNPNSGGSIYPMLILSFPPESFMHF